MKKNNTKSNIIFVNDKDELVGMLYNGDVVVKNGYKAINDSQFLYIEEKDEKIFVRYK